MACRIDHSGDVPRAVEKLEDSQAGYWRHRCAGCAYLLGRKHADETEERLRNLIRDMQAKIDELKSKLGEK
jgi:hypothetical protein